MVGTRESGLLSQLFSPATINISPGVDWKPNTNFSLFFSPASARIVTVLNNEIAQLPAISAEDGSYLGALQGNPQTYENGVVTSYDNIAVGVGALAKAKYNNTFLEDRVAFSSELNLYFDYLNSVGADKNVPTVDWLTSTTFNIFKGIGVTLSTGAFYDYTKPVSSGWRENADGSYGYETTKRGIMFTETLALTYSRVFGAKKE